MKRVSLKEERWERKQEKVEMGYGKKFEGKGMKRNREQKEKGNVKEQMIRKWIFKRGKRKEEGIERMRVQEGRGNKKAGKEWRNVKKKMVND